MIKAALLSCILLCFTGYAFAQPAQNKKAVYESFKRRAFEAQFQRAVPQKTTAIKERLVGASGYDMSTPAVRLIDSISYRYSGTRGSTLSPNDNERTLSYYDNCYFFIREGMEDPTNETLFYDTAYTDVPINLGPNTILRNIKQRNAAGLMSNYIVQKFNRGGTITLVGQTQYQYTYDPSNHCTKILKRTDTSAGLTGKYAPVYVYTATYSAGLLATDSSYDYSTSAPDYKGTYTYTAGKLTMHIQQAWDGSGWVNDIRDMVTYDGAGRVKTAQIDEWNGTIYAPDERDTFGYTGTALAYTWWLFLKADATGSYKEVALQTAKLTSFGALDTVWDSNYNANKVLRPAALHKFVYNAARHLTSERIYNFTNGAWATTPYVLSNFYYQSYNDAVGIPALPQNAVPGVSLYPMPVRGTEFYLKFDEAPKESPGISIYDIAGRRVSTASLGRDISASIPISSLVPGMYLVEVRWDNRIARLKMMKE